MGDTSEFLYRISYLQILQQGVLGKWFKSSHRPVEETLRRILKKDVFIEKPYGTTRCNYI